MAAESRRSLTKVACTLAGRELRQNALVYLLPLPFFLFALSSLLIHGSPPILGTKMSLAALAAMAVLAIVYGQQGLAGESDRQTLDFLLTKPVPPALLTVVKYLINAGSFAAWVILFGLCLRLNLPTLPLPETAVASWLVFALLALAGMSFLSGLLSRGAERLLVTILLTAGFAGPSYVLWSRILTLVTARYFWPDVPPPVYNLVCTFLPAVLLVNVLLAPPVIVLWYLRGRTSLARFRPLWRLLALWGALLIVAEGARATLGPAVWPLPRAFVFGWSGDWHPRAGVALAGPASGTPVESLFVARLGGQARPVFRGTQVRTPRWSPDGKTLVFADEDWLKTLRGRSVARVARGEFPYWSADGSSLAFAVTEGREHKVRAIYRQSLRTGDKQKIWDGEAKLLGLAWDSIRRRLYLFDRGGVLLDIDLRAGVTDSIPIPAPVKLSVQNPWGVVDPNGLLYLTVTYGNQAHIFTYRPGSKKLSPFDDCAGRVSAVSQTILSPGAHGYLWPRLDRAYEYRGFPLGEEEEGEYGRGDG